MFKQKKFQVVFALCVVSACIAIYTGIKSGNEKNEVASAPPVTISKAAFGFVQKYVDAIGTLMPNESVVVKSEVDARIVKINFTEGGIVKQGDLLIELDDIKARASLMEAEAQLRKAISEHKPLNELASKGYAAIVNRDTKKADVDTCMARVEISKNMVEKHKIFAPIEGTIGLKSISAGEFLAAGKEIVKIVDCHPMKVGFQVQESQVSHIYVGQTAKITIDGDEEIYTAKITAIDPECDKITHCFDVRAVLDLPEDATVHSQTLKPGRFAKVKIELDGDAKGIVIPESSLEKVGDEDTVFRIVDGVAIRTLVSTGITRDGMIEVISGINDGEIVITSGHGGVLDGKPVSIQNYSVKDIADAVKKINVQKQTGKK